MKDLFETPELIPPAVQAIIDTFDQDGDPYKECRRIEDDLKPLGYTIEWGLDGEPYNLRSIIEGTKAEQLKARVLEIALQLVTEKVQEIQSGIYDRIYDAEDNVDTLKELEDAKQLIEQFKNYRPEIMLCVEGGNIQGASASEKINFRVFDLDNWDAGKSEEEQKEFIEMHGTPEAWDEEIDTRTEAGELTPIF